MTTNGPMAPKFLLPFSRQNVFLARGPASRRPQGKIAMGEAPKSQKKPMKTKKITHPRTHSSHLIFLYIVNFGSVSC